MIVQKHSGSTLFVVCVFQEILAAKHVCMIILGYLAMEQKHVLIFGGNGFIGYELLSALLEYNSYENEGLDWNITVVNRGKTLVHF